MWLPRRRWILSFRPPSPTRWLAVESRLLRTVASSVRPRVRQQSAAYPSRAQQLEKQGEEEVKSGGVGWNRD
jgi:hypothetical protein